MIIKLLPFYVFSTPNNVTVRKSTKIGSSHLSRMVFDYYLVSKFSAKPTRNKAPYETNRPVHFHYRHISRNWTTRTKISQFEALRLHSFSMSRYARFHSIRVTFPIEDSKKYAYALRVYKPIDFSIALFKHGDCERSSVIGRETDSTRLDDPSRFVENATTRRVLETVYHCRAVHVYTQMREVQERYRCPGVIPSTTSHYFRDMHTYISTFPVYLYTASTHTTRDVSCTHSVYYACI